MAAVAEFGHQAARLQRLRQQGLTGSEFRSGPASARAGPAFAGFSGWPLRGRIRFTVPYCVRKTALSAGDRVERRRPRGQQTRRRGGSLRADGRSAGATAVARNSPRPCRAVPEASWLPARGPRTRMGPLRRRLTRCRADNPNTPPSGRPSRCGPGRRHDSACASRPRAQPIRTRSHTPWPSSGKSRSIVGRPLRASAGGSASPSLGGWHGLPGACCASGRLAVGRRAAAGLL
jgi:hypothetical protein